MLPLLYFKTKLGALFEEREVKRRFYVDTRFRACDSALKTAYFWRNAYGISKRFLKERGAADIQLYGETPLTTWAKIAEHCGISKNDRFVDLGCGRGRGVFFLSSYIGCSAIGIEQIPEFVEKAQSIAILFRHPNVQFLCGDYH